MPESDPFVLRFRVRPVVWLNVDKAVPIHDDTIWTGLSFTKGLEKGSIAWTGRVRGSLVRLDNRDGKFLTEQLTGQDAGGRLYPLDEQESRKLDVHFTSPSPVGAGLVPAQSWATTRVAPTTSAHCQAMRLAVYLRNRHLATHTVTRTDKVVTVSVPDDVSLDVAPIALEAETRESIRVQALIASIGAQMGMSIWLPRADRTAVLKEWKNEPRPLLERLPLNYDDTTLRTVEQIDVLWLRGRSIVRAFEVEHTTSVYSGILRMADLLALQPNMNIKLQIVAPNAKREKVFQEIRRPVFSLLEKGPLADSCTYLWYDSLHELASQKHLAHLSDTVLDEYAEEAE